MESQGFHDQLIHVLLEEILGGDSPPDLTERILERAFAGGQPVDERDAFVEPRRRSPARWAIPLAAAASVVVALGLWLAGGPGAGEGAYAIGRIAKRVGEVRVQDAVVNGQTMTRLNTGKDSYCRVDQADGSVVAVCRDSSVAWRQEAKDGAKHLSLERGRVYLDVAKQAGSYGMSVGDVEAQIVGTRLSLAYEKPRVVSVLNGMAKIMVGDMGYYLRAGQSAMPVAAGENRQMIDVLNAPIEPDFLGWLDRVDMDPKRILAEAVKIPMRAGSKVIRGGGPRICDGVWRIDGRDGHVVISQELLKEFPLRAQIEFGTGPFKRGVVACRFKVRGGVRGVSPSVNFAFVHTEGTDFLGLSQRLPPLIAAGGWINAVMRFEIGDQNDISTDSRWWTDRQPAGRVDIFFLKTPENSRLIKRRDACRIGLGCQGCAVDFADLAIRDYEAWDEIVRLRPRVTDGRLAQYLFDEESGSVAHNMLKADSSMDLRIANTNGVQWLIDGLRVKGAADIRCRSDALKEAWRKSGGLTLDFWLRHRPKDMQGSELRKLACIMAGDRSRTASMSVAPIYLRPEADKFDHLVWILDEQGGQCHLTSYVNGVIGGRGQASDGDLALHQRSGTPEIVVAPSASSGDTKLPWMGDIIALTVYDRPLKAEEVEKNRLAGPPKGTGYWGEPSSQSVGAAAW